MQVKAVYDFTAEPGSGELSLRAGDILTVSRQDVGEGWWEGTNEQGVRGLFPESYVEKIATGGPPPTAPPPLPGAVRYPSLADQNRQSWAQSNDNGWSNATVRDSWGPTAGAAESKSVGRTATSQKSVPAPSEGGDDFEDDWSDDDSAGGQPEQVEPSLDGAGRVITTGGGVKKSVFRFSKFVQSGMEAFILNQAKLNPPPPPERVEIVLSKSGPKWATSPQHEHTCQLSSYKKSSKFKGLKSFISYELTPSFAKTSVVSRRYKHFDWLHNQLETKFTFMLTPLLPEKQVSGRFEEDFVEHRMRLLQLWVNKICRHPVMSKADVWMHFLTCHSEESKEWKRGKRKAEHDEYIGGNFFFSISAPTQSLDPAAVEQRVDIFTRKTKVLEEAVRAAYAMGLESSKHMCGPFKREFQKYGEVFRSLSQATHDETRSNPDADALARAIKETADGYDAIGKLYFDQPKFDLEPMMEELFIYKGMLAAVPHIANMQKNVLSRLREHQKLAEEGKITPAELESIRSRVDTVSYAMLAEINHFEDEHVRDIKALIKNFLSAQITFYGNVRAKLDEVLRLF